MIIKLFRTYRREYTKGRLVTPFGVFFTIERPNLGNRRRISCIPEGVYSVSKSAFWNGKHKGQRAFRIHDVPNRSGILIHVGNFAHDVIGCIAPGISFSDELGRTYNSQKAFNMLWSKLPDNFQIEIRKDNKYADLLRWKETASLPLSESKQSSSAGRKSVNFSLFVVIGLLLRFLKR